MMNHGKMMGACLLAAMFASAARAEDDAGFYIGAGIGQARQEAGEFEGDDTSFKLFGGWSFNKYLAVEGGYIDGGSQSDDLGSIHAEVSSDDYRPSVELSSGRWLRDGTFEVRDGRNLDYGFGITYGWNSEDDLLFPTQGSTLEVSVGAVHGDATEWGIGWPQFLKTWSWLDAYWTLKIGGDPSPEYQFSISENQELAVTYARPDRLKRC